MHNQRYRVMEYMKEHGGITPREADRELGVMRLAARISELKSSGVGITRRMVKAKNRFGDPVTFAEYRLSGTDKTGAE